MDEDEKVRREIFGASCTLAHWDRRLMSEYKRRFDGGMPQPEVLEHIERNRAYWSDRIQELEKALRDRPPGWGSW